MKALKQVKGNNRNWVAKTKHETLAEFEESWNQRLSLSDRILKRSAKDYFTFGFVRNPWDRMSSFYRYLIEKRPRTEVDTVGSFKDFLIQAEAGVEWIQKLYSMKSQLDYFTHSNDQIEVDFLGHFEFLNKDFASIVKQIGLSVSLCHANKSTNTHNDYRKSYDDEMIEIISTRFAEEIDLFGYNFDDRYPTKRYSKEIDCKRSNAASC